MSEFRYQPEDFMKMNGIAIPRHLALRISAIANVKYQEWSDSQSKLYGRKDEKDGWSMHEQPGDMDTHEARAFGFKELERNWD